MIQSLPEHNLGDQQMTYRMAALAIWNKINFALSLVGNPKQERYLWDILCEARSVANSIVVDEHSGDEGKSKSKVVSTVRHLKTCQNWRAWCFVLSWQLYFIGVWNDRTNKDLRTHLNVQQ